MPLAEQSRAVPVRAEGVGHGQFVRAEMVTAGNGGPHLDVMGIFPGHQASASGRAGRIDVEVRQAHGLGVKTVEIGSVDHRVAVGRDVAVSHVIDEYDNDVGFPRCGSKSLGAKEQAEG